MQAGEGADHAEVEELGQAALALGPDFEDVAHDLVLDAVRKDKAKVIPGRAKLLWRLSRFAPNLTDREIAKGMHKELEAAARQG